MASSDITKILNAMSHGEASDSQLLDLVYDELRALANAKMVHEAADHTLQATGLVHEVFLRMLGQECTWQNRRHFFGAAAESMRRILIEEARRKKRQKRGGGLQRTILPLDEITLEDTPKDVDGLDVEALSHALDEFQEQEPAKAELVKLRYFAGLSEAEAADTLDVSRATASRWWAFSKAWLFDKLRAK